MQTEERNQFLESPKLKSHTYTHRETAILQTKLWTLDNRRHQGLKVVMILVAVAKKFS